MKLIKKNKAWAQILGGVNKADIDKVRGKSSIRVEVEKAATKIEPVKEV